MTTVRYGPKLIAVLLLVFFVIGAVRLAYVRPPHEDEGHFASAAVELMRHGRLAMPMWTEWVPSLDRCMFVTMPLYFINLSVWARLFGDSLVVLRLYSVACGLLLVLAWAGILRRLAPDGITPILGLVFIAANYDIMNMTSGRYDPQAAALNALGLFAYVFWRESHFRRSVFAAHVCFALACLTHPYGIFGIAGFGVLFLFLDRKQLSFSLFAIAAVPYILAAGAWGIYASRYPAEFTEQLAANSEGRLRFLAEPFTAFRTDLLERYIVLFAGFRPSAPVYMRVKVLLLFAYFAAFAACLLIRGIRSNTKLLALVAYAAVCYILLVFVEGKRWYIYLVHALPAYSAVLAIALGHVYSKWRYARLPVVVTSILFVLYSAATVAYRTHKNEYAAVYVPTLQFLQNTVRPNELVMGSGAEFGPALDYRKHVLVDYTLGYRTGIRPDLIVADNAFRDRIEMLKTTDPGLYRHLVSVFTEYDLVFTSPPGAKPYRVYRRRATRLGSL